MRRLLQDHQNGRETLFEPGVRSLEARIRTTLETASEKATMHADNRTHNSENNGCDSRGRAARLRLRSARHCPQRNTNTAKHGGTVPQASAPSKNADGRGHAANQPNPCPKLSNQMKLQSIADCPTLIRENILYNCDNE